MVMSLWPRFLAHPLDAVAVCLSLAKYTCRMTKTKPHDSPGNLFFSVAKDLGEIRLESPPDNPYGRLKSVFSTDISLYRLY